MDAAKPDRLGPSRRALATLTFVLGTLVWTHALAGPLRAVGDVSAEDLAPASTALTLAAIVCALVGSLGLPRMRGVVVASAVSSAIGAALVGGLYPSAWKPALGLIPAVTAWGVLSVELLRRLPASLDAEWTRRPRWRVAWIGLALLAVVQVGRLATHVSDPGSDWFLSTRHPFYARHECATAYVYAAELSRRGDPNVYDVGHYPALDPQAKPDSAVIGLTPDDPFQYPPPFLLLPRLALALTDDQGVIRSAWFGINVTLCLGAVLALARWVGGAAGLLAGLAAPAFLVSFPTLHDFQYGQFHFAAIALAVLGCVAFQQRRAALGGALLSLAIVAKLFPVLLLAPLAVRRRWRDLSWTAVFGAGVTGLALVVLGRAPFDAFLGYQVPRLADGRAFAFDQAWPELATLVAAGNQGMHGIVHKLALMGVLARDSFLGRLLPRLFALAVLAATARVALRSPLASRLEHALAWLGLLGLGSLVSGGAWADYVPLTSVWVLTLLMPLSAGRPAFVAALAVCAVLQVTLLGTMPIGSAQGAAWMMPVSLVGALAMMATYAAAALVRVPAPVVVRS